MSVLQILYDLISKFILVIQFKSYNFGFSVLYPWTKLYHELHSVGSDLATRISSFAKRIISMLKFLLP